MRQKAKRDIKLEILKSKIRKEIKQKLNKQEQSQRLHKSRLIKEKLFNLDEFQRAQCLMFYIAKDKEVQTALMIREAQKIGKKIAVPMMLVGETTSSSYGLQFAQAGLNRFASKKPKPVIKMGSQRMIASLIKDLNTELTPGPYGIKQPKKRYLRPISSARLDLIVVPGLAFDKHGHRLGRGGGYYDEFLAKLNTDIPRIGLAFDFQLLKDLPTDSHDAMVTKVITA